MSLVAQLLQKRWFMDLPLQLQQGQVAGRYANSARAAQDVMKTSATKNTEWSSGIQQTSGPVAMDFPASAEAVRFIFTPCLASQGKLCSKGLKSAFGWSKSFQSTWRHSCHSLSYFSQVAILIQLDFRDVSHKYVGILVQIKDPGKTTKFLRC
jgi:hypothetical protein